MRGVMTGQVLSGNDGRGAVGKAAPRVRRGAIAAARAGRVVHRHRMHAVLITLSIRPPPWRGVTPAPPVGRFENPTGYPFPVGVQGDAPVGDGRGPHG